jgi:DNA-binding transcriptional regulator YdaS (Cro superfamily)
MNIYLSKAIQASGGVTALARALGINSQAVSQWEKAPAERVLSIAKISNWKVTPHQLRSDLYPHPQDGLPIALRKETA